MQARGLGGHLDGTTTKPTQPAVSQAPAGRELTEEEKEKNKYVRRRPEGMAPEGSHCLAASLINNPGLALPKDQGKANG